MTTVSIKIIEKVEILYPVFCYLCLKTGLHAKGKKDGWVITPHEKCICSECWKFCQ